MHLIKNLVHPGKYITKHTSWDQPKKKGKKNINEILRF